MPPIRAAIGLPPRASNRVGAHAEPHAELKDAGEQAGRRQSNDETLKDAKPGIYLHDPNEADDGICGHETVGIERNRKLVAASPVLTKLADIAGLETGIHRAPSIADCDPIAPTCDQFGKLRLFPDRKIGIVGIAEKVKVEALGVSRSVDTLEHRFQVSDDAYRLFVANAQKNGSRSRYGFVALDQSGRRYHGSHGIGGKPHDDETDHGITKSCHHPGQGDREQEKRRQIEDSKSARRQRQCGEP